MRRAKGLRVFIPHFTLFFAFSTMLSHNMATRSHAQVTDTTAPIYDQEQSFDILKKCKW